MSKTKSRIEEVRTKTKWFTNSSNLCKPNNVPEIEKELVRGEPCVFVVYPSGVERDLSK